MVTFLKTLFKVLFCFVLLCFVVLRSEPWDLYILDKHSHSDELFPAGYRISSWNNKTALKMHCGEQLQKSMLVLKATELYG